MEKGPLSAIVTVLSFNHNMELCLCTRSIAAKHIDSLYLGITSVLKFNQCLLCFLSFQPRRDIQHLKLQITDFSCFQNNQYNEIANINSSKSTSLACRKRNMHVDNRQNPQGLGRFVCQQPRNITSKAWF
ncbi:Protein of unknown function [Pyronema omphalodes CBS 100304]|uniref:Uncharacterized protein n=1 Tax=Pyronema omphalodes (strain CBS 100304) TaxID=1076935 RepID=U4LRI0_PYROM|nr:Protein of unknown function [Pyronema omphalodes CBS 100304]